MRKAMVSYRLSVTLLFFVLLSAAPARSDPKILIPLATGGAPPCPDHAGVRTFRSATVKAVDTSVFIEGTASRDASGCHSSATLNIEKAGIVKSYLMPDLQRGTFDIIDLSYDRSQLLLDSQIAREEPNELLRYVELAVVQLSNGEMQWHNVWDLLGWKDCDALIYPQGLTSSNGIVILAKPSVMSRLRRDNCVKAPALYEYNPTTSTVSSMPDNAIVMRHGKVSAPPIQNCKSDPDLTGACFKVHGRLSAWNGSPTWRISRTDNGRVLGVTATKVPASVEVTLPETLEKASWDVAAYAEFLVCPFTKSKPRAMQMVCIESATDVTYKPR